MEKSRNQLRKLMYALRDKKVYFKMYKSGKHVVFAGITAIGFATALAVLGPNQVHAAAQSEVGNSDNAVTNITNTPSQLGSDAVALSSAPSVKSANLTTVAAESVASSAADDSNRSGEQDNHVAGVATTTASLSTASTAPSVASASTAVSSAASSVASSAVSPAAQTAATSSGVSMASSGSSTTSTASSAVSSTASTAPSTAATSSTASSDSTETVTDSAATVSDDQLKDRIVDGISAAQIKGITKSTVTVTDGQVVLSVITSSDVQSQLRRVLADAGVGANAQAKIEQIAAGTSVNMTVNVTGVQNNDKTGASFNYAVNGGAAINAKYGNPLTFNVGDVVVFTPLFNGNPNNHYGYFVNGQLIDKATSITIAAATTLTIEYRLQVSFCVNAQTADVVGAPGTAGYSVTISSGVNAGTTTYHVDFGHMAGGQVANMPITYVGDVISITADKVDGYASWIQANANSNVFSSTGFKMTLLPRNLFNETTTHYQKVGLNLTVKLVDTATGQTLDSPLNRQWFTNGDGTTTWSLPTIADLTRAGYRIDYDHSVFSWVKYGGDKGLNEADKDITSGVATNAQYDEFVKEYNQEPVNTDSYDVASLTISYIKVQTVTVQYVDTDDGNKVLDAATATDTGDVGANVNSTKFVTPAGYTVDADSPTVPLTFDDTGDKTVQIKLSHHHTVTSADTNFTVEYTGAGTSTPPAKTESIRWGVVTDDVTGDAVYTPSITDTDGIVTPPIVGYNASSKFVTFADELPKTMNVAKGAAGPSDTTITVTYQGTQQSMNVVYKDIDAGPNDREDVYTDSKLRDDNGNALVTGMTGTYTPVNPDPTKYEFAPGQDVARDYTIVAGTNTITIELKHVQTTVDPNTTAVGTDDYNATHKTVTIQVNGDTHATVDRTTTTLHYTRGVTKDAVNGQYTPTSEWTTTDAFSNLAVTLTAGYHVATISGNASNYGSVDALNAAITSAVAASATSDSNVTLTYAVTSAANTDTKAQVTFFDQTDSQAVVGHGVTLTGMTDQAPADGTITLPAGFELAATQPGNFDQLVQRNADGSLTYIGTLQGDDSDNLVINLTHKLNHVDPATAIAGTDDYTQTHLVVTITVTPDGHSTVTDGNQTLRYTRTIDYDAVTGTYKNATSWATTDTSTPVDVAAAPGYNIKNIVAADGTNYATVSALNDAINAQINSTVSSGNSGDLTFTVQTTPATDTTAKITFHDNTDNKVVVGGDIMFTGTTDQAPATGTITLPAGFELAATQAGNFDQLVRRNADGSLTYIGALKADASDDLTINLTHTVRTIDPGTTTIGTDDYKQTHRGITVTVTPDGHSTVVNGSQTLTYTRSVTYDAVTRQYIGTTDWTTVDTLQPVGVTTTAGYNLVAMTGADGTGYTTVALLNANIVTALNAETQNATVSDLMYTVTTTPATDTTANVTFFDQTDNQAVDGHNVMFTGTTDQVPADGTITLPAGFELAVAQAGNFGQLVRQNADGSLTYIGTLKGDDSDNLVINLTHIIKNITPEIATRGTEDYDQTHRSITVTVTPEDVYSRVDNYKQKLTYTRSVTYDAVTKQYMGTTDWVTIDALQTVGITAVAGYNLAAITGADGTNYATIAALNANIATTLAAEVQSASVADLVYTVTTAPATDTTAQVTFFDQTDNQAVNGHEVTFTGTTNQAPADGTITLPAGYELATTQATNFGQLVHQNADGTLIYIGLLKGNDSDDLVINLTHAVRTIDPGTTTTGTDDYKQTHRSITMTVTPDNHSTVVNGSQTLNYTRSVTYDAVTRQYTGTTDWTTADTLQPVGVTTTAGYNLASITGADGTSYTIASALNAGIVAALSAEAQNTTVDDLTYTVTTTPATDTTASVTFFDQTDNQTVVGHDVMLTGTTDQVPNNSDIALPVGYELATTQATNFDQLVHQNADGSLTYIGTLKGDDSDNLTISLTHVVRTIDPGTTTTGTDDYKQTHRSITVTVTPDDHSTVDNDRQTLNYTRSVTYDAVTQQYTGTTDWTTADALQAVGITTAAGYNLASITGTDGTSYTTVVALNAGVVTALNAEVQNATVSNLTYAVTTTPAADTTASVTFFDQTDNQAIAGHEIVFTGTTDQTPVDGTITLPAGFELAATQATNFGQLVHQNGDGSLTYIGLLKGDDSDNLIINLTHTVRTIDPGTTTTGTDDYNQTHRSITVTITPDGHSTVDNDRQTLNYTRSVTYDAVTQQYTGTTDWTTTDALQPVGVTTTAGYNLASITGADGTSYTTVAALNTGVAAALNAEVQNATVSNLTYAVTTTPATDTTASVTFFDQTDNQAIAGHGIVFTGTTDQTPADGTITLPAGFELAATQATNFGQLIHQNADGSLTYVGLLKGDDSDNLVINLTHIIKNVTPETATEGTDDYNQTHRSITVTVTPDNHSTVVNGNQTLNYTRSVTYDAVTRQYTGTTDWTTTGALQPVGITAAAGYNLTSIASADGNSYTTAGGLNVGIVATLSAEAQNTTVDNLTYAVTTTPATDTTANVTFFDQTDNQAVVGHDIMFTGTTDQVPADGTITLPAGYELATTQATNFDQLVHQNADGSLTYIGLLEGDDSDDLIINLTHVVRTIDPGTTMTGTVDYDQTHRSITVIVTPNGHSTVTNANQTLDYTRSVTYDAVTQQYTGTTDWTTADRLQPVGITTVAGYNLASITGTDGISYTTITALNAGTAAALNAEAQNATVDNLTYTVTTTPATDTTASVTFFDQTDNQTVVGHEVTLTGTTDQVPNNSDIALPVGYELAATQATNFGQLVHQNGDGSLTYIGLLKGDDSDNLIINLTHTVRTIDPGTTTTGTADYDQTHRSIMVTVTPDGHSTVANGNQTLNYTRSVTYDAVTQQYTGATDWTTTDTLQPVGVTATTGYNLASITGADGISYTTVNAMNTGIATVLNAEAQSTTVKNLTYGVTTTPATDTTAQVTFFDQTDNQAVVGHDITLTGTTDQVPNNNGIALPDGYELATTQATNFGQLVHQNGDGSLTYVGLLKGDDGDNLIINLTHTVRTIDPGTTTTGTADYDQTHRSIMVTVTPDGHSTVANGNQTLNYTRSVTYDAVSQQYTGTTDWTTADALRTVGIRIDRNYYLNGIVSADGTEYATTDGLNAGIWASIVAQTQSSSVNDLTYTVATKFEQSNTGGNSGSTNTSGHNLPQTGGTNTGSRMRSNPVTSAASAYRSRRININGRMLPVTGGNSLISSARAKNTASRVRGQLPQTGGRQRSLPQTSDTSNVLMRTVGLAVLASLLGMFGLVGKRRKHDD